MGTSKDTVISTGKTADGKSVCLWSDGSLTWGRMGTVIKGSPFARTPEQVRAARDAGWLVMGEISLYDADEISKLIASARKTASGSRLPGDLRKEFGRRETREDRLTPHWQTLEADRNGKPTLRVWKLPALLYGRIAVWDDPRAPDASRGRYHVMREMGRSGTYAPTGDHFHDLDALSRHLLEERGRYLGAK